MTNSVVVVVDVVVSVVSTHPIPAPTEAMNRRHYLVTTIVARHRTDAQTDARAKRPPRRPGWAPLSLPRNERRPQATRQLAENMARLGPQLHADRPPPPPPPESSQPRHHSVISACTHLTEQSGKEGSAARWDYDTRRRREIQHVFPVLQEGEREREHLATFDQQRHDVQVTASPSPPLPESGYRTQPAVARVATPLTSG